MGKMEDYEGFYNQYVDQYGSKTVVLYQFGKFHEIYGVDNSVEKVGNVAEIANFLGIKETRVNTKILDNSRQNPQMAGFNSVGLDERVEKLVNHGYTVVVVNQVPGTSPIQRAVSYIQSPSTTTNVSCLSQDPYLVSIYIDKSHNKSTGKYYSYIGMSAIDATTGDSYYYESNSTVSDPTLAEDDLTRFIQTYNPAEIILNRSSKVEPDNDLVHRWGFRLKNEDNTRRPTVFTDTGKQITKLSYQEEFLSQYFKDHGFLNVLEYLDLVSYDVARTSYVYLLDFCSNHNARLLNGLSRPKLWNTGNTMILDTSSIIQLNIIESYYNQQRQDSVVSLLAKSVNTAMGRRIVRDRLLNPITDIPELRKRYDCIEIASDLNLDHSNIGKVRDLDRLQRKLALGTLTPAELYITDQSLQIGLDIANKLVTVNDVRYKEITDALLNITTIRDKYLAILDIEEAGRCTVTEHMQDSIFKLGWNIDIDELSAKIRSNARARDIICQRFSNLITPGSSYCKYKEDLTGDSCYCSMTKTQFKKFKDAFPSTLTITIDSEQYDIKWSDIDIDDRNKTNVKFTLSTLSALLKNINVNVSSLRKLSIKVYGELLTKLTTDIGPLLQDVSHAIGLIDYYLGMNTIADKYSYCRPKPEKATDSYLDAERLRHPLIERKRTYIPQTIKLGIKFEQCGILLYGVNQTGKSCTMKSVGVALIMAQAGMYVPAQSFNYSPYDLLTTRILGNDSIDRGLSTFAVEMIELRSILTRCNNKSLNLGDEVCHGTESASAVALVGASIRHMSNLNSSFIFATHLHELSKMEEVTSLPAVKQYHLTIEFDGDKIIYNRVMKPGSGLGLYGIEVAKHLQLPTSVLNDAYEIRNKYYSTHTKLSQLKSCRYNSNVIVSKCRVGDCTNDATETHHIRHQVDGVVVDGQHKNIKDNLVPVCERHHLMTHGKCDNNEFLVIFGYSEDGKLDYRLRKKNEALIH